MRMKKISVLLLLSVIVYFELSSQKAPIKFGDVSMDELKMTSSYLDSTAPAVILCDYGHLNASSGTFTRTLRIKILTKDGYGWANHSFSMPFKSGIRGFTTNLADGKMVQDKLTNDLIYSTRIYEDEYMQKVAMPNVKVGSVIDLEFKFKGIPGEWRFQEEIPVVHSELILEDLPDVRFRKNFFGFEKLFYSSPSRWVAKDMPAFKREPYMSSINNYITRLKFDILSISTYDINTSWERMDYLISEESPFYLKTTSVLFLNSLANKLEKKFSARDELLKGAYDTIRTRMNWNQVERLVSEDGNIAEKYKTMTGSSAEINLILFKLLKRLNFDTHLLALSTVDNGTLSQFFPSYRQLNYTIVEVKEGDKQYLLDATEKYIPFGMLPMRCFNGQARLIENEKGEWVTLEPKGKIKDLSLFELAIDKDLNINGKISFSRNDYSAFNFRRAYYKFNSKEEYLDSLMKSMPGLTIKDEQIENLEDIYKPLTETLNITIRNQAGRTPSELLVIPLQFYDLRENPFKTEDRKFPVDFGVPIDKTLIIDVAIPDGYSIGKVSEAVNMRLPENGGAFIFQAVPSEKNLKLSVRFNISKTLFIPEEYTILKEYFNQVIKKMSEPIVFQKKA